jgi:hypothetical protein
MSSLLSEPLSVAEDRALIVPRGKRIATEYIGIFQVKLACRERMAMGDVNTAFQKRLQLGDRQPWPCPYGYWERTPSGFKGGFFVIVDGRHEWVAAVMLGHSHILCAYLQDD